MSILMVKGRYDMKLSLPGGKREQGNMQFIRDEQCWHTITREFKEEVDDDLDNLCFSKCKFFDTDVMTNVQESKLKDPDIKKLVSSKFEYQNGNFRIPRKIRTFYLEVNCQDIPDVQFGRFHFYETIGRQWVPLESITSEIRMKSQGSTDQLQISQSILSTLKLFCNKIMFVLQSQFKKTQFMLTFDQLLELDSTNSHQHVQMPILHDLHDKLIKIQLVLRQVNKNIRLFPIYRNDESFIFAI